jgi:uncharacterized protein with FMN-binding domain
MSATRMRRASFVISVTLSLALGWAVAAGVTGASHAQDETVVRSRYEDGTYTATGQYGGQPSFITVTVTLRDDVVTDVEVQTHATVPRSLELQRSFAAAVPQVVVGRPIDEIKVGKLAGSSSTPDGFNAAISQIREQAAR